MYFIKKIIIIIVTLINFGCKSLIYIPEIQPNFKVFTVLEEKTKKNKYESLLQELETLNNKNLSNIDSKKIQLNTIHVYFKFKKFELAHSLINKFIKFNYKDENIDYLLYIKGIMNIYEYNAQVKRSLFIDYYDYDINNIEKALKNFLLLINNFPHSKYYESSKNYVSIIKKIIIKYELSIIEYYFRKNAHYAVINRVENLISRFPDVELTILGIHYMEKSYRKLGFSDRADKILRIINVK